MEKVFFYRTLLYSYYLCMLQYKGYSVIQGKVDNVLEEIRTTEKQVPEITFFSDFRLFVYKFILKQI